MPFVLFGYILLVFLILMFLFRFFRCYFVIVFLFYCILLCFSLHKSCIGGGLVHVNHEFE